MHETAERLYKAALLLKGIKGQSALATALGQTPQTIYNWEKRGVSKEGALTAEALWGVSALWLRGGGGNMTVDTDHMNMGSDVTISPDVATMDSSWPIASSRIRPVFVVGRGAGGSMPERLWTDSDYPVGATDEYASIATSDPHALLIEVIGTSMVPRYNPGEFALVEPETEPEIDDDVLVRLTNGETLLKRLVSRSGGYRFGSYNTGEVLHYTQEDVSWIYYVAHPVPRRKIKSRT